MQRPSRDAMSVVVHRAHRQAGAGRATPSSYFALMVHAVGDGRRVLASQVFAQERQRYCAHFKK